MLAANQKQAEAKLKAIEAHGLKSAWQCSDIYGLFRFRSDYLISLPLFTYMTVPGGNRTHI